MIPFIESSLHGLWTPWVPIGWTVAAGHPGRL